MIYHDPSEIARKLSLIPRLVLIIGSLTTLIAFAVLVGWYTHNVTLIMVYPTFYPLTFNTAIMILLGSFSLISLASNYRKISLGFSLTLLLLSGLFAAESFFNINLRIDELLFQPYGDLPVLFSMRPAANSSMCLFALALAYICIAFGELGSAFIWISGFLTSLAFAASIVIFYAYLGGFESATYSYGYTRMSFHGASAIALMSIGGMLLAYNVISQHERHSLWYSSALAFSLVISFSLAIHSAWNKQITKNLTDLLTLQATEINKIILEKLEDIYSFNMQFRDRMKYYVHDEKLLNDDVTHFFKDFIGLKAINLVDNKGEIVKTFYKDTPLNTLPLDDIFNIENINNKPYAIFQAQYDDNFIHFIYDPYTFLDIVITEKGDLAQIQVSMDDFIIFSNENKKTKSVISVIKKDSFKDLQITSQVRANNYFFKQFKGILPNIFWASGMTLSVVAAGLVYLLQRFRGLAKELALSNKIKMMFLAKVSHEIRTPLHGILGSAFLMETTALNPKQKKYLTMILDSGKQLRELVENLLNTSEAAHLPVITEVCDRDEQKNDNETTTTNHFLMEELTMNQKADYSDIKVLVAEDDLFNQEIIVDMLGLFGIKPDVAENGKIASEKASKGNYKLILMDIRMPEMDGYQATEAIRKLPIEQPTIIALTASVVVKELERFKEKGLNDYLIKPIEIPELEKMISRYITVKK